MGKVISGLYVNIKMTKMMETNNTESLKIENEIIKVLDSFIFLGSLVHIDEKSDDEIMEE